MLRHLITNSCRVHPKVGYLQTRKAGLSLLTRPAPHHTARQPPSRSLAQGVVASGMPGQSTTPVKDSISEKITSILKPISLEVKDESSQHAGHAAMKGLPPGETHFRVAVVSQEFEGLTTIKRHKLVYQILAEELAGPVHALSLKTKTPAEE